MLVQATLLLTALGVPCSGGGPGCSVDVKVNRSRVRLLVDTGADLTVLSEKAARKAGIRTKRDAPFIIAQGVGGSAVARLAHAKIRVGEHEEEDVVVAIIPGLDMGARGDGLLGMTFLERFEAKLGSNLELEPIDAKDSEKRGGHGESWWSLRFRAVDRRVNALRRILGATKRLDREIANTFGESESGDNLTTYFGRLETFAKEEKRRLRNKAARSAVPLSWRR